MLRSRSSAPTAVPAITQGKNKKCSVGCPILNSFLRGGIPCGSVTELVGECGSGKTLLSLQMLLTVQLPVCLGGLEGRSLYIYTEGRYPGARLLELAEVMTEARRLSGDNCNDPGGVCRNGTLHAPKLRRVDENRRDNDPGILASDREGRGDNERRKIELHCLDASIPGVDRSGFQRSSLATSRHFREDEENRKDSFCVNGRIGSGDRGDEPYCTNLKECERYSMENRSRGTPFAKRRQDEIDNQHLKCLRDRHLCDKVFVKEVQTIEELLNLLDNQARRLLNHRFLMPVKLIIIDSVAALFRSNFENTKGDLVKRAVLFFRLAGLLKQYAEQFNIAIVVTNQVVDCFDTPDMAGHHLEPYQKGDLESMMTSGRGVRPALGISWAHCINTRLFLSIMPQSSPSWSEEISQNHVMDEMHGIGKGNCAPLQQHSNKAAIVGRQLQVVFAPHLPRASCDFIVTREGIRGVPVG